MDSHSVLHDQHPASRNHGRPSRFIMAVLAMSLLANAYFLLERRLLPSLETEAVAAEEYLRTQLGSASEPVASNPSRPVVTEVEQEEVRNEPEASSSPSATAVEKKFKVQRASFFAPEEFPGREIKTLHFSVKESLTYTLCQLLPEADCKLVSAYMGRLLMWHLDVNRHLRQGDAVSLVYERLKQEEDIRILRLEFESGYLKERLVANYYQPSGADYGVYYDDQGNELALRLKEKRSPPARLHRDHLASRRLPCRRFFGTFRHRLQGGCGHPRARAF